MSQVADTHPDSLQSLNAAGKPLKIAFLSPFCLLDSASGAAQSVRTMLEQLALRGADCRALTACCFDVPPGDRLAEVLGSQGLAPDGEVKELGLKVWQGRVRGVTHQSIQFASQARLQMTPSEELTYRDVLRGWLGQIKPDVVLTFGGLLLDIEIQRCVRAAGALVGFYLANPSYGRRETFDLVDLILTNSQATADHYAAKLQLRSHPVGLFVDAAPAVAKVREPQYVTFINPLPDKGVTLFLKLVARAAIDAPDMKFLVVESRGRLGDAMRQQGLPDGLLAKVAVVPKQDNIASVFGLSKVLLMPSYWFEAAGRILIEANANGVPVLATNRGGIPETLGGAGCLLPIPERCTKDYTAAPNDEELQPWWDALLHLWRDAGHWQAMSERALSVAATQTLPAKAARLESLIRDALSTKATKENPSQ